MTTPPEQPGHAGYGAAPPYGAAPYGSPPYGGYGAPPPYGHPGWGQPGWSGPAYFFGPPGRIRPTGQTILLFIVTLGIYGFVYNYSVHDEMKRHSGRGIGGGIALLLTFLANIAMPFITPMEVGGLYTLRGQKPPVNGWTGLWVLLPAIGGYIVMFILFFASFAGFASNSDTGAGIAFGSLIAGYAVFIGLMLAGGIVWFTKTNNALNAYWHSVGVPG